MKFKRFDLLLPTIVLFSILSLLFWYLDWLPTVFWEQAQGVLSVVYIVFILLLAGFILWLCLIAKKHEWTKIKLSNLLFDEEIVLESGCSITDSFQFKISGNLHGSAEISLYDEDRELTNTYTLRDSVFIKVEQQSVSTKYFLKYHPVSVRSGELKIEYIFCGWS